MTHPISTLHKSCSSAGERAQRKLWVEVLFLQTRWTTLSCRDLRDYMSKTSKKQELKIRREAGISSSLDTPKGNQL